MAVVETERHGQIFVVRMNRPERLNALNTEMRLAFALPPPIREQQSVQDPKRQLPQPNTLSSSDDVARTGLR